MSVADFIAGSRKISMRMPKQEISRRLANLSYEEKRQPTIKSYATSIFKVRNQDKPSTIKTPKPFNVSLRSQEAFEPTEESQWKCCKPNLGSKLEIYVSPSSVISGRTLEKDYNRSLSWLPK